MALSNRDKRRREQTARLAAIAILISILLAVSVYALIEMSPRPRDLVIDWRLKITFTDYRTGSPVNSSPPAFIGVGGGIWLNHELDSHGPPGYAPVSTRDDSGTIYVQLTRGWDPGFYTFGYFFDLWGKPFNRDCVGLPGQADFCGGGDYVNPIMSDGGDEYCLNRDFNLSHGKDWIIIVGASFSAGLNCGTEPT